MEKIKYRKVSSSDFEELNLLNKEINKSKYRQKFHIQPLTGLLNDPNGFSYYKGKWHLFYQWFPFDSIHGTKAWYHTVSNDLVHFENRGIGIYPNTYEDNHGAYSGSALQVGDDLFIYYTGNNRDKEFIRNPKQMLVKYDGEKYSEKEVLIDTHPDYTEHQRDPKIVYDEKLDKYYIIIGAQTKDKIGCILVYESTSPDKDFTFKGRLNVKGFEDFGYMWECPDLISMDGKDILLFSPQGLEAKGEYFNNIYQNGYIIGKIDLEKLEFIPESDFIELDRGFDFYASQTANHPFDSQYLIAWMGLPDTNYPTEADKWSGSLTMVRELSLCENKIYQYPVEGYRNLRKSENIYECEKTKLEIADPREIEIENIRKNLVLSFIDDENILIELRYKNNEFVFTRRSFSAENIDGDFEIRYISNIDVNRLNIFIDTSSIEIFINEGEYSLTSRYFKNNHSINLIADSNDIINIKTWKLDTCIDENFVL